MENVLRVPLSVPGSCLKFGSLLFAVTTFALLGYLRFFIASWASLPLSQQEHSSNKASFTLFSLVSIFLSGIVAFLIGAAFIHLSNSIHIAMSRRVAHAPMRFFRYYHLGRIVKRFSKDKLDG